MLQKIKAIKCNRYLWLGILIVEILLGGVFYCAQSNRESVELNFAQEDLIYSSGESGFYLDASYGNEYYVSTPDFTLPKGFYTLEIQYECFNEQAIRIGFSYIDGGVNRDVIGTFSLEDPIKAVCDFRVKYNDRPMTISARLSGDAESGDYLLIRGITIVPASVEMRNFLFRITAFFLCIDVLLFLYMMKDKFSVCSEEVKSHCKILLLLILFTSIPLMVNYLLENIHDLTFHLMRIEGIKESLLNGMFPVKIQQGWLNGHGYAASVFYGDIFLYIPAILRIFGVSIQASYQFFVLLINMITVFLAYYCFSKMSSARIGLVCTFVYSLSIYRLLDVYQRVAVGEYTAITFMPLVLYGLWKVYMLPEESKEHEKSWITITFGCTGVFLSHMISTEMTALFIVLTALILWKKTFRKRTFLVLIKSVIATVLLNLWFLIPFLDYIMNGTYVLNNPNTNLVYYDLEKRAAFVAQLFMNDYVSLIGRTIKNPVGIAETTPLTVGSAGMAVLAGWFLFCFGKKERNREEKKAEYLAVVLCILSLWMATYLFPYTWLADKISILQMPAHNIQFSWRFLAIAGVMITYLLCLILQKDWITQKKKQVFAGLLICLTLWQGLSYMSGCLKEGDAWRFYQAGELSTFSVGSAEYIPVDWNENFDQKEYLKAYMNQLTYDADAVSIADWYREKGRVVVDLTNSTENICQVEVPLLLYKGYHAVADSGEELTILPGESYRISVSVPAGFSGSFSVAFREPWYWRVCEVISLLTLIGMTTYAIYAKRGKASYEEIV